MVADWSCGFNVTAQDIHIKIQQFIFRYTFMDNNIFWTHITYKNYLSLSVLALTEGGSVPQGCGAK